MEFCNTMMMMLPLTLYLLKDSVDMCEMSQNEYLNIVLLGVGLLLNRENFQGMVYVMFVFYMIQTLSMQSLERKKPSENSTRAKEGFEPEKSNPESPPLVLEEEKKNDSILGPLFSADSGSLDEVMGVDDASFGNYEQF